MISIHKFKFSVFFVFIALLISCDDDNSDGRKLLKTVTDDYGRTYEYFYEKDRLDHWTVTFSDGRKYLYTYQYVDNKVDKLIIDQTDLCPDCQYTHQYIYRENSQLDKIIYTRSDGTQSEEIFTYTDNRIHFTTGSPGGEQTTFEYDSDGNVSKMTSDQDNSESYTYFTNKKRAAPLKLDLADPRNQIEDPIATFRFTQSSHYSSSYKFDDAGYPTEETQTFEDETRAPFKIRYSYY